MASAQSNLTLEQILELAETVFPSLPEEEKAYLLQSIPTPSPSSQELSPHEILTISDSEDSENHNAEEVALPNTPESESESDAGDGDDDSDGAESACPKIELEDDDESNNDYLEWDDVVVILDSSDDELDDDESKVKDKKKMVCYRCRPVGKFRNYKKHRAHIKRHVMEDKFECLVCNRTFDAFNKCISHEMRVHGIQVEGTKVDSIIQMASDLIEYRREQVGDNEPGTKRKTRHGKSQQKQEYLARLDQLDPEDPFFYGAPIVTTQGLRKSRIPNNVQDEDNPYALMEKHCSPIYYDSLWKNQKKQMKAAAPPARCHPRKYDRKYCTK